MRVKQKYKIGEGIDMSQTVQEQTGQELLSVRGITKRFGLNVVLKGIDLSVGRGEVLTLIGGNGAGKSTLMKIIMGIYQPDQGEPVSYTHLPGKRYIG